MVPLVLRKFKYWSPFERQANKFPFMGARELNIYCFLIEELGSVDNLACSTGTSIDYKFEFAICSRASNFLYFEFWLIQIFLDVCYIK